jgi:PKD repeat protein
MLVPHFIRYATPMLAWCCTGLLSAAVTVSPNPAKWQPMTVDCTGPSSSESSTSPNPFLNYRYQVVFTSPSQKIRVVNGYFDGDGNGGASGNVWRARLLPDEQGVWTWKTSFRSGTDISISTAAAPGSAVSGSDNLSGSFTVGAVPSTAQGFFKKGLLQCVGSYYPRFQDGTYFLKAGADSPETLFGYSDFDNTPNASHTWVAHVGDWQAGDPIWSTNKGKGLIGAINWLAGKGTNSIYFLTMNIGGDGKDVSPYLTVANWAGSTSNDSRRFDLSKLAQWRVVMEHAQRRGVMLHVVLSEGERANKNELDASNVGTERRLYYREMSARFGDLPALQWNVCEEYDIDLNIGETKGKAWGAAMADYDAHRHPLAIHNTGIVQTKYQQFLATGQPFTTTSLQDRSADNTAGSVIEKVRSWAALGAGPRPIQIDEFDDVRPTNTVNNSVANHASMMETRREYIWPSYFSGAAGVEIYCGGSNGYDQAALADFRLFQDAYQWMAIAHQFVTTNLPFHEMVPADNVLTGESSYQDGTGGSKDISGEVFAKPGSLYAVYYPNASNTGTIALPAGNWSLTWFNPRSGVWVGSAIAMTGGSVAMPAAPSDASNDWVALITKVGGGTGDQPPTASFSTDVTSGTAPLSVTFNAGASSDDLGIASYAWQFGDGSTGSGSTVTHTYTTLGNFTAQLTVTDTIGQTATSSTTISVNNNVNLAPAVSAGADQTVILPAVANMAGSVQDDGQPSGGLTIQWTVVSGPGAVTFADANEPATTASFSAAGTYVLRLTGNDGALSVSDDVQITVQLGFSHRLLNADNDQPIAGFNPLTNGAVIDLTQTPSRNLTVQVVPNSSIGSVKMDLTGAQSRTQIESVAPYGLFGDTSGNFNPWSPAIVVGTYTLTSTLYSAKSAAGTVLGTQTITFTVIDSSIPPQGPG